jgi:prepilin-type N-terminal cleavage/methylation domain-containing protein
MSKTGSEGTRNRKTFTPLEKASGGVMGMRIKGRSSLTGFTLLELILVMVVLSILLAVSAPAFKTSVRNAELKNFTSKLYLFLDYARTHATLKNVVLGVTFDNDEKAVTLEENGAVLSRIAVPDNIAVTTEEPQILFYPDGTSQQFKAVIQYAGHKRSVILSRGFDGKIKIEDYAPEN